MVVKITVVIVVGFVAEVVRVVVVKIAVVIAVGFVAEVVVIVAVLVIYIAVCLLLAKLWLL